MLPGSDREAVGGMRGDQGKPESSSPWKQHFQFFTFAYFRGSRMKEVMSNNSTTSISQARKAVEQLKMEACMDRVKVSMHESALPSDQNPAHNTPPVSF